MEFGSDVETSVPGLAVGFRHATILLALLPFALILVIGVWYWRKNREGEGRL